MPLQQRPRITTVKQPWLQWPLPLHGSNALREIFLSLVPAGLRSWFERRNKRAVEQPYAATSEPRWRYARDVSPLRCAPALATRSRFS